MKKKVSKSDMKSNIKKLKLFFRKHYIEFFKEFPLLFCFIVSSLVNTLLLRIITVGNYIYIKPLITDMGMLFIISSFMFLFKSNKKRRRYLLFWCIFLSILCIVHSVYYTYYDSFASISLLATSTFVVDVGDAVVEKVLKVTDLLYLWQPIFFYYFYFKDGRRSKEIVSLNDSDRKFSFMNMFFTGIVIMGFAFLIMSKTEWSRFSKMWNRESVVSSFGVCTYQINDIFQSLEPKINNLFGHDKALKKVIDYYDSNKRVSNKNDYTNIFKGKNVIVIHAESLQSFVINRSFNEKEVSPTINKLAKEGIYFSNYYSEVGVGTSSDAEFTFSTSLMPSSNGTVFVNYFDREYETIQKAFKDENYYVFSMHGNTGDFWNRATMHKNMGYDKFYSKSSYDIDETIGLGISDKSFFKQSVPMIKKIIEDEKKPFYGTMITLTNHTPWSDLELMDEYDTTLTIDVNGQKQVKDYLKDTTMGDYLTSVHYMDQAIEQFINDLDKEGILDNTVIVIYGDHDSKIKKSEFEKLYYNEYINDVSIDESKKISVVDNFTYEINRKVPFIIWTKDMAGTEYNEEITKVMGIIDVMPTLGNMLGVRNDFALGHDIFNTDENIVVFPDGSFITDKVYYDGSSEEYRQLEINSGVSLEYLKNNSDYANKILSISSNIITHDFIKKYFKEKNLN